jgi:hypothetical protein
MIRAFERLTKGVLAVLGEDALFDGVTRTRINIEYDVQFAGFDGEQASGRGDLTVSRDVATVSNDVPNVFLGKTFQFVDATTDLPAGQRYRLDKFVDHSGYSKRFIVIKVA